MTQYCRYCSLCMEGKASFCTGHEAVLQYGGTRLMNAKQIRDWLDKEGFICDETVDQNFNMKEGL